MAAKRLAKQAVDEMGAIYGVMRYIDPEQGIIEGYWRAAGAVEQLSTIVAALQRDQMVMSIDTVTETTSPPDWDNSTEVGGDALRSLAPVERKSVMKAGPNIWIRLYNDELDRMHRYGLDILKYGLEARRDAYLRDGASVFIDLLGQLNLTEMQRAEAVRLLKLLGRRARGEVA
jgi:hypothetical protein